MSVIVTIHGVNDDGSWQEEIAEALWPNFRCVPLKHEDFNDLIKTTGLVLWRPSLAALTLVAFVASLACAWLALWSHSLALAALALLLFAVLLRLGKWNREEFVLRMTRKFETELKHDLRAHVVAHSLGTYIAGWILDLAPSASFDRVVLVGCIQPRTWPWCSKIAEGRVSRVQNEVGCRDWVVAIASWAGLLPWVDFGTAGRRGFKGSSQQVRGIL